MVEAGAYVVNGEGEVGFSEEGVVRRTISTVFDFVRCDGALEKWEPSEDFDAFINFSFWRFHTHAR